MSEVDDMIARSSEVIDRTRTNSLGASTRSRKSREGEVVDVRETEKGYFVTREFDE